MPKALLIRAAARATGHLGWARGAIGAMIAVLVAAGLSHFIFGPNDARIPWIVAPIGASAVLLFMVPASPLAQPWPVAGGSLLSALIGLTTSLLIPDPILAAAIALPLALAAMSLFRCLHPPGGACALVGALAHTPVTASTYATLLLPLSLDLAVFLTVAWAYNTLTGHPWPHRATPPPPQPVTVWHGSYETSDLDSVLADWDELIDVSRDDLDAIFRAVESRVRDRWQENADQTPQI